MMLLYSMKRKSESWPKNAQGKDKYMTNYTDSEDTLFEEEKCKKSDKIKYLEQTTHLKTIIKTLSKKKWRQQHPNYNQSDSLHKLNRPEQVILFRLRTGHNRLNAHMYNKCKIGQSEMCPCNADIMTAEHYCSTVDCMML